MSAMYDPRPRVAIVGSGISGLVCAWLLRDRYRIQLFEANNEFGGHTQTTDVRWNGQDYPVNTGFIVYNDRTYPSFIRLLDQLKVATRKSDMSFSVHCHQTGLEYNGSRPNKLFGQRRNLLRPAFWGMIRDILRFNRETLAALEAGSLDDQQTLGHYLRQQGYGDYFRRYYIIPMGAAIWSSGSADMMDFPLQFFLRFFANHGLLSISNRPQWRVIEGGSREYVRAILRQLPDGCSQCNRPVTGIQRTPVGVDLYLADESGPQTFNEVILACHSDQALQLLRDPNDQEQQILGAIPYQNNEVVLHTDASLMPQRKAVWASWNYHLDNDNQNTSSVTYWMNRLQGFDETEGPFCVTLNRTQAIAADKIIRRFNYAHPVFTRTGIAAQQRHHLISGHNHTHYCGAYWFNGFHEDGVRSALRVCAALGVDF